jgi:hypothetical protein
MNANRILAGEWFVAIAFTSYFAIKKKYWPWPPTIIRISLGFGVFGIFALAAPEVAAALASGFLLAGFLKIYQNGLATYAGGVELIPGYVKPLTIPLAGETKTSAGGK